MKSEYIIVIILGCIFLTILLRLLATPLKLVFKLLLNTILGIILLCGINYLGRWTGLLIPINIYTAILVGFLGIPGIIALLLINAFFL